MVGEQNPWHTRRIADLFSVKKSNTLSRDKLNYEQGACKDVHYGDVLVKYGCVLDLASSDVPYITNNDDVTGEYLCDGDVVFADTAEDLSVGKACEIAGASERKAVAGLHTIVLRPQPGLFASGFLGYYVNSRHFHETMIPFAHGTKVTSISSNDLLSLVIPIPPRPEQEAIAKTLDDIDSLIESLEILIAKKRDLREGLAQELLTGARRLPGFDGPWHQVNLQDALELCTETIPVSDIDETTYVGTENMLKDKGGVVSFDKHVTYANVREYLPGDILFSNIRPYLKKIWFADRSGGCSNDVLVLRSVDANLYDSHYCYLVLSRDDFFAFVTNNSSGTKMPRGDKEAIKTYQMAIPKDIGEQRAIAQVLADLDNEIQETERKLDIYKQVKQGMMRELLTGRIRLAQE